MVPVMRHAVGDAVDRVAVNELRFFEESEHFLDLGRAYVLGRREDCGLQGEGIGGESTGVVYG